MVNSVAGCEHEMGGWSATGTPALGVRPPAHSIPTEEFPIEIERRGAVDGATTQAEAPR